MSIPADYQLVDIAKVINYPNNNRIRIMVIKMLSEQGHKGWTSHSVTVLIIADQLRNTMTFQIN